MTATHEQALAVLVAAFPAWRCPRETAALWIAQVQDVAPDALIAAATDMLREDESAFPNLARWRRRALEIAGVAEEVVPAAAAWGEVVENRSGLQATRAQNRLASWKADAKTQRFTPSWSSEPVRLAAESVNWDKEWLPGKEDFLRAQFERYLEQFRQHRDYARRNNAARQLQLPK